MITLSVITLTGFHCITKDIISSFRHIFCDAYRKGVFGNKYQWLIVGMFDDNWWMKEGPCKPEEIKKALVGAMIMDILPLASSEDITVSKRVRKSFHIFFHIKIEL
jgi:hypothetical protein